MGVANFFDRALMSAGQAIRGIEPAVAEARLQGAVVDILFDRQARERDEGRFALDMAVRLLTRLYPALRIRGGADGSELQRELEDLARSINPEIDLRPRKRAIARLVFSKDDPGDGPQPIFVGSEGWIAKVGSSPQGFGSSSLPFGAGAAACLACANLFRLLFADELEGQLDVEGRLSLFDFSSGASAANPPAEVAAILDAVPLVGVGAIGNGFVWALARTQGLSGELHLVDHEAIELSNLQRYVLATQRDVDRRKVILGKEMFSNKGLIVEAFPMQWAEYVGAQGHRPISRAVAALDSAADRIAVQAALPRRTQNAWTQPGDLGVSRHDFLGSEACLACLYMPEGQRPNHDQLIAGALALPQDPDSMRMLREMLANNQPVGETFVRQVAAALAMDPERLLPLAGQPLHGFYVQAVCGGLTLDAGGGRPPIEVPLAFQSALAGIMLAAELVVELADLRPPLPTKTVINVLRPIGSYLNFRIAKLAVDVPAPCICTDEDFVQGYCNKHGLPVPAGPKGTEASLRASTSEPTATTVATTTTSDDTTTISTLTTAAAGDETGSAET